MNTAASVRTSRCSSDSPKRFHDRIRIAGRGYTSALAIESESFAVRLHQALGIWTARFGALPSAAGLAARGADDPSWARFSAKVPPLPLGPNDGDWALLRAGLKDVLRERVAGPEVDRVLARCHAEGFATQVVPDDPVTLGPEGGLDTAPLVGFHLYVSRHLRLVQRAADLDARVPAHQTIHRDPDPHAAPRTRTDAQVEGQRELGELLGYPACCTDAFLALGDMRDNRTVVESAASRTRRFEPLLNNVDLGAFHAISFFPCRYDCPQALSVAERVDRAVLTTRARRLAAVSRLARTRLYLDERRQLVFDRDDALRLRRARPASAYRRGPPDPIEWIYWVQQSERDAIDLAPGVLLRFGRR